MCGRYALFSVDALRDRYGVEGDARVTYNAAPGQRLPVVEAASRDGLRRAEWGLIPPWADDATTAHVNARAETLRERPSFRDAYGEGRRCLVPADGFYEWADGTPHFVRRADGEPFVMAGLRASWTPSTTQAGLGEFGGGGPDRTAETRETFAVVTTEARGAVADLHHRSARILDHGEAERWLTASDPADLLVPSTLDLVAHPVSTAVNDPSNDRPALVERV